MCARSAPALDPRPRERLAPEESIASARRLPVWSGAEALAHTLCYAGVTASARAFATIGQSVLVATGGGGEFFEQAAGARGTPAGHGAADDRAPRHGADLNAVKLVLERLLGS